VSAPAEKALLLRLEPARASDFERLFNIRMRAMHESLQRLGRFDMERGRRRFQETFRPEHTRLIIAGEALLGCVALGPHHGALWLEHFYIVPEATGRGVGSQVMTILMAEADAAGSRVRLDVVRESDAKRFYERHGFSETHCDALDIFMERPPFGKIPRPV